MSRFLLKISKYFFINLIFAKITYIINKKLLFGGNMRAVITVIGKDKVGIIARISNILADSGVNILDISQTIMQEIFTMIMLVDTELSDISAKDLADDLAHIGDGLGVEIKVQHERLFSSMHRI
jgi:ACT domain-containing protein